MSGSRKIDFRLPLVNAHTHAAMVAFRGMAEDMPLEEWLEDYIWPMEKKKVKPGFVFENTRKAIVEMKENGIRLFADMYFFQEEVAKAAEAEKIHVLLGEAVMDVATPSQASPEQALAYTENLAKKYRNSRYVRVAVAPHSIYTLSEKYLIGAKKLAKKYRLLYHIHASETLDEYETCLQKRGLTPVAYLESLGVLDEKTLLVHCVYLSPEDLEIMAKRKVTVVHCPLSNLKLGSGVSPVGKILDKGIRVVLGTDGAASSNRLDIWEAGRLAVLLQKGLTHDPGKITARKGIEMMTIDGLEALGFEEIDGRSIGQIRQEVKRFKDFNFLYEANVEELKF